MGYFQMIIGLACLTAVYGQSYRPRPRYTSSNTYENTNYPPPSTYQNTNYPPQNTYKNTNYPPQNTYENTYPPQNTYKNTNYPPRNTYENTYPPSNTYDKTNYPPPDTYPTNSYGNPPVYPGGYAYESKPCSNYGEKTPVVGVCFAYFECVGGENIYQQCEYGYSFNHYNGECEKDDNCHTACPYHIKAVPGSPQSFYLGNTKIDCAYGLVFNYYYCTCVRHH